ncbi:MAG: hypothetical protein H6822_02225 [Planctomycetaceae bacterium]|nr:hypothetical protein [Planctomycetales bacterium]MCB9920967.1 hypothetical protein [Planctomycetaceae bacterium]
MRVFSVSTTAMAILGMMMLASGCSQQESTGVAPVEISGPPPGDDHSDHEGHDHGAEGHDDDHAGHDHGNEHKGPHGGHVIELGRSHEYHAELVDDEAAGSLTVYILGKDLKELAIDANPLVMNLVVDGQAKTFQLAAATEGQASRFNSQDKALFEALHVHEASGKLRVTINGAPYTGDVEHHDHHGDEGGHDSHKH